MHYRLHIPSVSGKHSPDTKRKGMSMNTLNEQILLASRPIGPVTSENFAFGAVELGATPDGQGWINKAFIYLPTLLRWNALGLMLAIITGASSFSATAQAGEETQELDHIDYRIVIKGSAQKAWDAIADFDNYANWNQWMVRLDGEPELGAYVKGYADSGLHLDLKITSFRPLKEICWVDVTWFTHLGAGGWRCRRIEELPNGKGILFINHFQYTGTFGRALEYVTRDFLEEGMQLENQNLKAYIEGQ